MLAVEKALGKPKVAFTKLTADEVVRLLRSFAPFRLLKASVLARDGFEVSRLGAEYGKL